MATFTVNQVTHLYVANKLSPSPINSTNKVGDIYPQVDADGNLFFEYMGVGGIMKTDFIDPKTITQFKATDADKMGIFPKISTITLNPDVNGGNPVVGQNYRVKISFSQYNADSDEYKYFKFGEVVAKSNQKSILIADLAKSLAINVSDAESDLFKIYVADARDNKTLVTKNTKLSESNYEKLLIEESPQKWIRGKMSEKICPFTVSLNDIQFNGIEMSWGKVEVSNAKVALHNGKKTADYEHFCMGERGDFYRGMGYPNNIETTYLVDPNVKYNYIDIHYSYIGSNESVQKSEKHMVIVVPKIGDNNAQSNALINSIIDAINVKTGLNVSKLAV